MSKRLPLKKVAVVGTGILGAQIAMIAAHTGTRSRCLIPGKEPFNRRMKKSGPT